MCQEDVRVNKNKIMSKRPTEDYIRPTLKRGEADMMRKITGSTCNFKIGSRPRLTKEEYDEFMQWRYEINN